MKLVYPRLTLSLLVSYVLASKKTIGKKAYKNAVAPDVTDLEAYISTKDSAYGWVDNNWEPFGKASTAMKDYPLADYNWITLRVVSKVSQESGLGPQEPDLRVLVRP